jgi:lysine 2,3-aminomutase
VLYLKNNKTTPQERRQLAKQRAEELKGRIQDYLAVKDVMDTGTRRAEGIARQRAKILKLLGGREADWQDWKWQMRNRISTVEALQKIINLSPEEAREIAQTQEQYRWAISPYYASLIDPDNPACPVRLQAVPSIQEALDQEGSMDPMGEEFTSPAPCITRRYPDRLIINVTNQCAMYCRHCQRRRNIEEIDRHSSRDSLSSALNYIRNNPEVRDVLITGGDALLHSNELLDWLLGELDAIPHVEIKRLGTRTLVTLPQRITPELCQMLEKHHPLYINTQFNHPLEITEEVASACHMLCRVGIPLGNQAVLLKDINDDAHVMKKLNHELLKVRIRPYYLFHAKSVRGTSHFVTTIQKGLEIMAQLRGFTSGFAIPTYIVNAPNGYGKTPLLPQYLLELEGERAVLKTWEGRELEYKIHD